MKILFFSFCFFFLITIGGFVAHATTTPITITSLELDQLPFTSPAGPADLVQKIFTWAILLSGTLAVIMIVYGGIQYVVLAGNESAQKDAKEIILGSVWGIVLLAGGWLILNTINPQLVSLSNLGLENVTIHGNETILEVPEGQLETGTGFGETNIGCTVDNIGMSQADIAALANTYLSTNPSLSAQGSCVPKDRTSPNGIVVAIRNGQTPYVCDRTSTGQSCNCEQGGNSSKKILCPLLLQRLTSLQQKGNTEFPDVSFTISSLMGGDHAPGSTHYEGRGVDITVNGSAEKWQKVLNTMAQVGFSAKFEYNLNGNTRFTTNAGEMLASGGSNFHIHANTGGAGSPDPNQQQQLREELKQLATEYLSMSPNLKSDGSFGILPDIRQKACVSSSAPRQNISDTAAGMNPVSCNASSAGRKDFSQGNSSFPPVFISSCSCAKSNVALKKNLLNVLKNLQGARVAGGDLSSVDFRVVTLMGGIQSPIGQVEHGYSGGAFEIVPMSGNNISQNIGDWKKLLTKARALAGNANAFIKFEQVYVNTTNSFVGIGGLDYVDNIVQQRVFDISGYADNDSINEVADDFDDVQNNSCTDGVFYKSDFSSSNHSVLYDVEYQNSFPELRFKTSLIDEGCYNPRIHVNIY